MSKKRRKVKGLGCIRDLSGDLSNLRLRESRIEEMCCRKAEMGSILELSFRDYFGK